MLYHGTIVRRTLDKSHIASSLGMSTLVRWYLAYTIHISSWQSTSRDVGVGSTASGPNLLHRTLLSGVGTIYETCRSMGRLVVDILAIKSGGRLHYEPTASRLERNKGQVPETVSDLLARQTLYAEA